MEGLCPGEICGVEVLLAPLSRTVARVDTTLNVYNIWGEILHQPMENLLRAVGGIADTSPGLDWVIRQHLGELDDGVHHVHQEFVGLPVAAPGSTLTGEVPVSSQKYGVTLDLPDGLGPRRLPIFGDVEDVLHENVYANENPVVFEAFSDIPFVPGIVIFWGLVRIGLQLLYDGRPDGNWR